MPFSQRRHEEEFIAAAKRKGRQVNIVDRPEEKIHVPNLEFQLTTSPDLCRLAVKMVVGAATYVNSGLGVWGTGPREFLLGESKEDSWTLQDATVHAGLEKLRSPLSHAIYVEGNRSSHCFYGLVQFYGLLQIYVVMNDGRYSGDDFAAIGLLSPAQE